jgi:diguanylate cyclase (GGDEF)-like protein/PAS domain S-box-containing protein
MGDPAIHPLRSGGMATRLLDAAPVGMLLVGLDGAILYSNRAFSDMVGYVPAAEHPFALLDMVHVDDRTALRLQIERLIRGETRFWRGECRFRHADQNALWFMVAAKLLDGEAGEPGTLVIQLTNIELQKKAEEALAYSEARWNSALESARQGVWDYDLRRDRMFYSRMWRDLRGIPDDEDIGEEHDSHWLDRIHPDDRERVGNVAKKQGLGIEGHDTLEYRERTRDGRYIWILSRGKPIEWDEHGNALRAVGTDTDITHLKTIELELAAEKERLRVTLQSIADGMISADAEGRIEFMNAAAEQLTGMAAAAAQGRPIRDVFRLRSDSIGTTMDCPVRSCFDREQPVRVEDDAILLGHDGVERDIRCTAAPVLANGGAIAGAVLVFQDVSQSRALQKQLAHTASHDALTGLTNRAAFERLLDTTIAAGRANGRESSLIYLDLDHFKPVNDSAGHAAGDALLRQVAQTIRESCRAHDVVARIGGDEFAVILEGCPAPAGQQAAEKIVRAIGALVFLWAGKQYRIGASAGLTMVNVEPSSPLGFLGEADAACYAAKAEGRGRAIAFRDMLDPLSRNRR